MEREFVWLQWTQTESIGFAEIRLIWAQHIGFVWIGWLWFPAMCDWCAIFHHSHLQQCATPHVLQSAANTKALLNGKIITFCKAMRQPAIESDCVHLPMQFVLIAKNWKTRRKCKRHTNTHRARDTHKNTNTMDESALYYICKTVIEMTRW